MAKSSVRPAVPDWDLDRGARGRAFVLLTARNRYPSRLANFSAAVVVKLVTPRLQPSRIGQYLVEFEADGGAKVSGSPAIEFFLYGLSGSATASFEGSEAKLAAGSFAYVRPGGGFRLTAGAEPARLLWIKRAYEPVRGLGAPPSLVGHRDDEPFEATPVAGFRRRELLPPDDRRHDFNMSLLAFEPGTGLPQVEIHDEEHGLYMTAGRGTYHLDGRQFEVEADDFIYMAPYCPQSFVAGPSEPAEYLLYKDVFRDGF